MDEENKTNSSNLSSTIEQEDEWRIKHGLPPRGEHYITQRLSEFIQSGDFLKEKENPAFLGKSLDGSSPATPPATTQGKQI